MWSGGTLRGSAAVVKLVVVEARYQTVDNDSREVLVLNVVICEFEVI